MAKSSVPELAEEAQADPALAVQREREPIKAENALKFVHEYLQAHGIASQELTSDEAIAKAQRLSTARTKAAQVLSRGRALDHIDSVLRFVPDGQRGQLVRENDLDINRYRSLGYEVLLDVEGSKAAPNSAGDTRIRVGDMILMVIDEDVYVAIERERMMGRARKKARTDPKAAALAERDKFLQDNIPIITEM